MQELREERGLTIVHPYDQPEVLLGNGSCGLEILEDLPDVDVVVMGVGGGGLIGGVTVALKESRPAVRVYGVEPDGSEAMAHGPRGGEPVPRDAGRASRTGWARRSAGRLALDVARRYLDGSCSSTTRRSSAGCGSRWSGRSRSWSPRAPRRCRRC